MIMKNTLSLKVDNEKIYLELDGKKKSVPAARKQSEKLLKAIVDFCDLKKVKAISINNTGSSFTALRIGVTSANALAYGLGIEIIPTENKNIFKVNNKKYAAPVYDREPNIG